MEAGPKERKKKTPTQLDSWGGDTTMSCYTTYTSPHRPSKQVWRRAGYNKGNMRSSCLTKGANTLYPQGWASYMPLFGTGGCPSIGSVWHWRINTPFTPNTHIILASINRRKQYKFCCRCSGRATKTSGTDGQTSILQKRACPGARVQPF